MDATYYILFVPTCLCLQHDFHAYNPDLLIYMCLPILAIWLLYYYSPGEFHLTPLDSHVQVLEPGARGSFLLRTKFSSVERSDQL